MNQLKAKFEKKEDLRPPMDKQIVPILPIGEKTLICATCHKTIEGKVSRDETAFVVTPELELTNF